MRNWSAEHDVDFGVEVSSREMRTAVVEFDAPARARRDERARYSRKATPKSRRVAGMHRRRNKRNHA